MIVVTSFDKKEKTHKKVNGRMGSKARLKKLDLFFCRKQKATECNPHVNKLQLFKSVVQRSLSVTSKGINVLLWKNTD